MATTFPKEIAYSTLRVRNPEYNADFWKKCRALYAGGPALLNDDATLRVLMPKHNAEDDSVYKERLARAFYIPYPGSIIDKIVSELTGKPVCIERAPVVEKIELNGAVIAEGDKEIPEYYAQFFRDCSQPGGKKNSINQLAREQMLTALQCRFAWTLIDMPKKPAGGYANRKAQEEAKALNAYAVSIPPECVIDWEEDDSGEFLFVLIQDMISKRSGLEGKRDEITLRYRYYTPEEWALYELKYDKIKRPNGPQDSDKAKLIEKGSHSFKRVPVRRMALPEGLWAMGKLEAMARAHLNQRNALSWGQLKALFPMPILFAGAPNPLDPTSEDAGRTNQRFGPGNLWVLSGGSKDSPGDRMEYFSPDSAPYVVAAQDLDRIRDEMHRVLHHMAMSVDNSGAALGRSAESKAIDQVAASVILRALGVIVREHLEDVYDTVAAGRGEEIAFQAKGMDNFEDTTVTQIVTDAMTLESVAIPSATFQKKYKLKVAKLVLGPDATQAEMEEISDELDESITQEGFAMAGQATALGAEAEAKTAERTVKGEPDPAAMKMQEAKAKAGSKSGFSKSKKPAKKPAKKTKRK